MNCYELIQEYRAKHRQEENHRRWFFYGPEREWVGPTIRIGDAHNAAPEGPWFEDMRILVAKLRLLGIEVTWPGDDK